MRCLDKAPAPVLSYMRDIPLSLPRLRLPPGACGKEKIRGRLDLSGASGAAYGSG